MGLAAFVSPMAGVALSNWVGIRTVLFLGGSLRFLGGMICLLLPFRGIGPLQRAKAVGGSGANV